MLDSKDLPAAIPSGRRLDGSGPQLGEEPVHLAPQHFGHPVDLAGLAGVRRVRDRAVDATLTASTIGDVSRIVAWTVPMACELAWAPSMVALRASSWVCDAIPKISFTTWR